MGFKSAGQNTLLVVGIQKQALRNIEEIGKPNLLEFFLKTFASDTKIEVQKVADELIDQERKRRAQIEEQERLTQIRLKEERDAQYAAERKDRERQWAVQQAESEKKRMEDAKATEMNVEATVEFRMPVFASSTADQAGKLILPQSALERIIHNKVAFPLTFEMRADTTPSLSGTVRNEDGIQIPGSSDLLKRSRQMDTTADGESARMEFDLNENSPSQLSQAGKESKTDREMLRDTRESKSSNLGLSSSANATMDTSSDSKRKSSSSSSNSKLGASVVSANAVVHAGVSEFNAPNDTVLAPRTLMRALNVSDGQLVHLKNVNLAKGKYVKLQPLDASWLTISSEERKALLEFELRKIQFLSQGSRIVVHYTLQSFNFLVMETKPAPVISITDTDLETEVVAPVETVTSTAGLELGQTIETQLLPGEYAYYSMEIDNPHRIVSIEAKPLTPNADPDLYISLASQLPSNGYPSLASNMWNSQNRGASQIVLSQHDPQFGIGRYLIAVRAYPTNASNLGSSSSSSKASTAKVEKKETKSSSDGDVCKFSLSITELKELPDAKGQKLGTVAMDDSGTVECSNCRKRIPKGTIGMHEAQCKRINYRCDKCDLVMSVREKDKHIDLVHTPMACLCGAKLEQPQMRLHNANECPLRLMNCEYCPLRVTQLARGAHQAECGMRPAICRDCGQSFKRKEIKWHLSRSHGHQLASLSYKDYG